MERNAERTQAWIGNIADQHFPGAVQIVDLYHARQHLWDLARKLYPNQEAEQRRWMMIHQDTVACVPHAG